MNQEKLASVKALGDGDTGVSKGERERMARALANTVKQIEADVHELRNFQR